MGGAIAYTEADGFKIGAMSDGRNWKGNLDDIRTYGNVLTEGQINNIMNEGGSGSNGARAAHWTFEQGGTAVTTDPMVNYVFLPEPDSFAIDTTTSATQVADITGNGLDLNFIHLTDDSWVSDAEMGNSVKLNGVDQFGVLDSIQTSKMLYTEFSIVTNVKIEAGATANWSRIAGISDSYGLNVDGGFVGMWCNHGNGWHGSYATSNPIDDGQWHSVAMTHSNTDGNIFYVDGQVVLEQDWSAAEGNQIFYTAVTPFAVGTSISDWDEPVLIKHNLLNANLNNLKVYDRVLTKEEIVDAKSNLIVYYDYEKVAGSVIPDVTPNAFDGMLEGAATVEGKVGDAAISLHNQAIQVPEDVSFTQSSFTIASWVKVTEDLADEWYAIFMHDFEGINEFGFLVTDGMGLAFHAPGLGLEEVTTWNGDELVKDEWAHVAVTVDNGGTVTLYLNGESILSQDGGHPLADMSAVSATWVGGNNGAKNFPGVDMDDTRFYGRALSAEEILLLAAESYKLDVTVNGQGSVTKNPDGSEFLSGTDVELTATANDGYEFTGWTGDAESIENPMTITMNSDMNITANFEAIKYALNITIVGNGSVSPQSGDYSGDVFLTATPDDGWKFDGWSGDVTGNDNPAFIHMSADVNVTATFVDASGINNPEAKSVNLISYPNPFSGTTTISYTLNKASNVNITVYDELGREIMVLVNKTQISGDYQVEFDGTNLDSGIYYYQFRSDDQRITKKMILNR